MTPEQHEIERRRAWVAFVEMWDPGKHRCTGVELADSLLDIYDRRFPAPVEREAEPVQSGELPRVQSLPAVGATIEEMRANLDRTSPEYAAGDMVLRWVNEGAIIMHGGVFQPAPKQAAKRVGSALPVATPTEPDWIDHTPGDRCPCEPGELVRVRFRDGSTGTGTADGYYWGRAPHAEIIAWKPAQ